MHSFFELTPEQRTTLLKQFKLGEELNLDSSTAALRTNGAGSKAAELRAYLQKIKAMGATRELVVHLLEITSKLSTELTQKTPQEPQSSPTTPEPKPELKIVVSPPQQPGSSSKLISYQDALKEIIEEAEEELLISTYSFHNSSLTNAHPENTPHNHLNQALSVLLKHKATLAHKKLKIKLILQLNHHNPSDQRSDEERIQDLNLALQKAWPQELAFPEIWYESPTTASSHYAQVPQRQSQHSKVVIADARVALIGSANLSQAAYERNIEVGCLIRSSEHVTELLKFFKQVKSAALLSTLHLQATEKTTSNWISKISQEDLSNLELMCDAAYQLLQSLSIQIHTQDVGLPALNQTRVNEYDSYVPLIWSHERVVLFEPVLTDKLTDISVLIAEREDMKKQLIISGWHVFTLDESSTYELANHVLHILTGASDEP